MGWDYDNGNVSFTDSRLCCWNTNCRERAVKTSSLKSIIIMALVVLILGIAFSTVRIVPAGHVGVVDIFGNVPPNALNSGINFVNPMARVVNMSVRTQEEKETMSVPSKEGLNVALDIAVLYKLDPKEVVKIYKIVGAEYRDVILVPQFRAVTRGVTVGHEAKALYMSEREVLSQAIHDSLNKMVMERGIVVENVLLRSITLPNTVSATIEQKLKAEQESERMKFILQREEQEAERKRIEAKGIRDSQSIINASITAAYLHYLWISTLNQNPNVIYVATEANMPMFRAVNPDDELMRKAPITQKEQK